MTPTLRRTRCAVSFFVGDLDPAHVALVHQFLDLGQQTVALDLDHFDRCGFCSHMPFLFLFDQAGWLRRHW